MKRKNEKANSKKGMFVLLVAFMTVCVWWVYAGESTKEVASSRVDQSKVVSEVGSEPKEEPLPAESEKLYKKLDEIIYQAKKAAEGEPETEKMVSDFEKFAVVGTMTEYGKTSFTPRKTMSAADAVRVLFVGKDQVSWIPQQLESPYLFKHDLNAVVCVELAPVSDEVLATLFLHELYHWRNFIKSGRRLYTDAYSKHRLAEEVRAHELENRAVDRITNGAFSRTIQEVMESDSLSALTVEGTRWPINQGWNKLIYIWPNPPRSELEKDVRKSGAAIAFQFAQMKNEDEKMQAYAKIRRKTSHQDLRQ